MLADQQLAALTTLFRHGSDDASLALSRWLSRVDLAPPYEFFLELLGENGQAMRKRMLTRLGPEAAESPSCMTASKAPSSPEFRGPGAGGWSPKGGRESASLSSATLDSGDLDFLQGLATFDSAGDQVLPLGAAKDTAAEMMRLDRLNQVRFFIGKIPLR